MGGALSLRGGVILTLRARLLRRSSTMAPDSRRSTWRRTRCCRARRGGADHRRDRDQWHEHGGRQVDPRAHHGELDGGGVGGGAPARAHRGAVHARRRYAAERRLAERFRALVTPPACPSRLGQGCTTCSACGRGTTWACGVVVGDEETSQNAVVPQVDSDGPAANAAADAVNTMIGNGSFSWSAGSGMPRRAVEHRHLHVVEHTFASGHGGSDFRRRGKVVWVGRRCAGETIVRAWMDGQRRRRNGIETDRGR